MPDWSAINRHIGRASGQSFKGHDRRAITGGCINAAYALTDGTRTFFVKLNQASRHDMFAAEAAGLKDIQHSRSIRVPAPLCQGISHDDAYLVLEYLPLSSHGDAGQLGRQLAQMHQTTAEHFGWQRDNTVGATPQNNPPEDDWIRFWQQHRLGFQLELAAQNGAQFDAQAEQLLTRIADFFTANQPQPSLLHGDLWSGNYAFTKDGQPVIFDPAVYYGDRETDLAMSELFGGFPTRFYAAYNEAWPLDSGYSIRKTLYNLYHILNHFNLFGGGYQTQARHMIEQLLSEVR